jgi:hypothetical protein
MFNLPNPYYVTAYIHSSNTHVFRRAGRVENSFGDLESHTMERLRDGQVKLGVDMYEDYASSQRPMVNQKITSSWSHHILLNVVEGRSEHL